MRIIFPLTGLIGAMIIGVVLTWINVQLDITIVISVMVYMFFLMVGVLEDMNKSLYEDITKLIEEKKEGLP